ncbi:hypothetical protein [Nocardioides sp. zg-DK7169]|uniref:hypothetical protein n=1 Tax=Nocardioides sp. zg-DK7169 TaxID=2736600 RepID=UPI001552E51B|nr:hypothetical protein [Nocardioides sp. zg-DK7169]NPC98838.1 hypothetical protein [Nocardioides sp. zg-DK7169]
MEALGDVFVERWLDLRRLPEVMDEVAAQAAAVVDHAVTWVARRDGFEPSPVCLLRPLGEAMDQVAAAFEELGSRYAAQWQDVRDAVVASTAELERSDRLAADDAARVHAVLPGPA